ncbi:hypothetical protein B9Z55_002371 [Caenorhabditis nigoni]|uniref:Uncharacterized protein n=1 Tax=Caenorhabditis nigoni TaxID=1611254 RepID=A0A2G5VKE3_9PELO|nr:hypothetical protein B9Z55_002371 [Caenorhabditis nigoni]
MRSFLCTEEAEQLSWKESQLVKKSAICGCEVIGHMLSWSKCSEAEAPSHFDQARTSRSSRRRQTGSTQPADRPHNPTCVKSFVPARDAINERAKPRDLYNVSNPQQRETSEASTTTSNSTSRRKSSAQATLGSFQWSTAQLKKCPARHQQGNGGLRHGTPVHHWSQAAVEGTSSYRCDSTTMTQSHRSLLIQHRPDDLTSPEVEYQYRSSSERRWSKVSVKNFAPDVTAENLNAIIRNDDQINWKIPVSKKLSAKSFQEQGNPKSHCISMHIVSNVFSSPSNISFNVVRKGKASVRSKALSIVFLGRNTNEDVQKNPTLTTSHPKKYQQADK